MNLRTEIFEIKALLEKANTRLLALAESQPKAIPGKPPQPPYSRKIEREIWDAWDDLKAKGQFTAATAWKVAKKQTHTPFPYRIDSAYSSILSRWAREGFIERMRQGRGQMPSLYRIVS
jgi:hypothetical protein